MGGNKPQCDEWTVGNVESAENARMVVRFTGLTQRQQGTENMANLAYFQRGRPNFNPAVVRMR